MENRPTAIFASDDYVAVGVFHAVIASGLSVPGDVAIIGADGLRIGEEVNVPLSTVAQPKYEYSETACEHIVRMIRGEHVGHTILPVELIVRESSQTKRNT
jgi:LacI family transcriptional regulator